MMRNHQEKRHPGPVILPLREEASEPLWESHGRPFLLSLGVHGALLGLLITSSSRPPHPPAPALQGQAIEITFIGKETAPPGPPPSEQTDGQGDRQPEAQAHPVSRILASPAARQDIAALKSSGPPLPAPPTASPAERSAPATDDDSSQTSSPTTAGIPHADDAQSTWERAVLAQLEARKRYPAKAQRNRQQDTVYIRIVVDRAGQVLSSTIYRSERMPLLDTAALDLVKRSSPLPPPPATVEGQRIEFVIPVEYSIRNNR